MYTYMAYELIGVLCGDDPAANQNFFPLGMARMGSVACLEQTGRYHLYIGYDAGVYGYGGSDVYAADLFHTMQVGWWF